jgi:hypothetical protein
MQGATKPVTRQRLLLGAEIDGEEGSSCLHQPTRHPPKAVLLALRVKEACGPTGTS